MNCNMNCKVGLANLFSLEKESFRARNEIPYSVSPCLCGKTVLRTSDKNLLNCVIIVKIYFTQK